MPTRLLIILLTVMLETISVGIILPVMPQLLASLLGPSLANAAIWGGVLTTAFSVSQFLFMPLLGALSDRFGRRPVLLVSLAVMAADFIVMALADSIWLLLVSRIISGVAAATYITALAYVADITTEDERAGKFGLVSAALGLGLVLGPVVGGGVGTIGPRAPFLFAAVLASINFALALVALPETLATGARRQFELRDANPVLGLVAISSLPGAAALVATFGLIQLAVFVYPAVWAFYVEANLAWGVSTIGVSLALYGVSAAVGQAAFAPLLLARFGEVLTIRIGLGLGVLCLVGFGIAPGERMVWLLIPMAGLATISTPALQGLLSRSVPADRQGELQGVLGSVSAVAMIVSPLVMTGAFSWGTGSDATIWMPGAPFVVAAFILAIAAMTLAIWSSPHGSVAAQSD